MAIQLKDICCVQLHYYVSKTYINTIHQPGIGKAMWPCSRWSPLTTGLFTEHEHVFDAACSKEATRHQYGVKLWGMFKWRVGYSSFVLYYRIKNVSLRKVGRLFYIFGHCCDYKELDLFQIWKQYSIHSSLLKRNSGGEKKRSNRVLLCVTNTNLLPSGERSRAASSQ